MLFLPFLASILSIIAATLGHASGEQTLPIPMLADFGKTILRDVKKYCLEHGKQSPKFNRILCQSTEALDNIFKNFGEKIMEKIRLHIDVPETDETGHSIFATIQYHIKKEMLKKITVTAGLKEPYNGFVTNVGMEIVDTMTGHLHQHIGEMPQHYIWDKNASGLNVEIGEIYNNADKIDKLKWLKKLFLTKMDFLKQVDDSKVIIPAAYGIQHVVTEIYKHIKDDVAEKQLEFFLDLFVANLKFIEINNGELHIAPKWQMRMTMDP